MPYIVYGNSKRQREIETTDNFKYKYPNNLDLHPNSKLHKDIVARVLELADAADVLRKNSTPKWRKVDNVLTTYVALDDYERSLKDADSRKPVSIVFPYSFAILDSILTYMATAFFNDPIFVYEGFDSRDSKGAALMQAIVSHHCKKAKIILNLYTMFRDMFAYGVGSAIPSWEVRYGKRTELDAQITQIGSTQVLGTPQKVRRNSVLYEGNVLHNVNPYLALRDPRVGPCQVQKGSFYGWLESTDLSTLLGLDNKEGYFNVQHLKSLPTLTSTYVTKDATSPNEDPSRSSGSSKTNESLLETVDLLAMYVKLIPSSWGMGNSDQQETWLFRIAADSLIVQAEPVDLDHNMMPVVSGAPTDDGRSPQPVSIMETTYGLQEVVDWLFNSHMINVRKSINNMLVVDPNLINMNDLRDPQPGKLIRLRRPAWGRGVEGAVTQLKIDDITRGNIGDTAMVHQAMMMATGTDQSIMGSLRQSGPDRLTKGEFQGTRSSAVSRLELKARLVGVQALQDLGYMFAVHTQQFMEQSTQVRLVGELSQELEAELGKTGSYATAKPMDILVDFDLTIGDGAIPGVSFSEQWPALYKSTIENPQLQQEIDTTRLFLWMARQMGAKNVHQFRRNVAQLEASAQVMPDQNVETQAKAGNIVPIGGLGRG